MKIQTLNKKQQKQLLELCNEFFPKYSIQVLSLDDNFLKSEYFVEGSRAFENSKNYFLIPWFQLCLTELPKRIVNSIDENTIFNKSFYNYSNTSVEGWYSKLGSILIEYKHPVDYLWNFVQKCKKNKYFKK